MFNPARSKYLKLVLDSTPDGITVQRPDGTLIYANAGAARLLGFDSAEELLDTPPAGVLGRFELADEDGGSFPLSRLPGRQVLQGNDNPAELLIRFRRQGEDLTQWSVVGARPVYDDAGDLLFVVTTFRYVTDYMNALYAERETRRRAEEAELRLAFLTRSSTILAQSLVYEETLTAVAQLAVPEIADWCAVDLIEERLTRVSVAHVDPEKVKLAYELQRRYPSREDARRGLYHVLRTGEPQIHYRITDEMLVQSARDEDHLRMLRQLDLRSVILAPLKGRESTIGAITMVRAESGRYFSDDDLSLAVELAQRAAMAVENARLYAQARKLNAELEKRVTRRTAALRQTNRRLQRKVEEVQEAERRFRALLESAPDAMIIVVQDGTIRLVNSQAQAVFGYARAEMLGRPVEMLIPDGLREKHVSHRQFYTREPRTRPMGAGLALVARHKNGHDIPVEISLSPLENDGELEFIIAAVRDVSDRRRAEEQIWRSEMQLAQAQAIAHVGSWEWDLQSGDCLWSKEMLRIYGFAGPTQPLTVDDFIARVHPEDQPRFADAVGAARLRGIPFSLHHRLLLEDGLTRIVHAQGTVETNEQGQVIRLVGASQDITMQREIDAQLQQSESLYRAMAENLPNGSVFVVDRDMRYLLARGSGLDLDISAWEGRTVADVAPNQAWVARVTQRYRKALEGERTIEEVRRGGRVFLIQAAPLYDSDGAIYAALSLAQDVTEQREAEETTRQLLELSRNLNATLNISALIATLSNAAAQLTRADHGHVRLLQPQLLDDASTLQPLSPEQWPVTLCVAIASQNNDDLGFLEVARANADHAFSSADRERLDGLAQIAAIALQNAISFKHLRRLGQQLVTAHEAERRSLSRELHDSTGQILTALKMTISMLQEELAAQESAIVEQIVEIGDMVHAVYEEIRAVSHALRPPSLEVNNIDEALHGLCEDYARHSGLNIAYEGCDPPPLAESVSISLYRLLQEALTNVAKHANASQVHVRLHQGHGEIELSVRDDGVGFQLEDALQQRGQGVGLLGLQERFELLGGRLQVQSHVGGGTHISGAYRLNVSS